MTAPSSKRPSSPTSETNAHKKARIFASRKDEEKPQIGAKIDPTSGQRGAFPGLEENGEDGEQLFYGPADNGLAYLRMVRLEAKGVPNLLVAPNVAQAPQEKDLYSSYEPRGEGFYSDGAYVAHPSGEALEKRDEGSDQDPQEAYYVALLEGFDSMRHKLSTAPPLSAPQVDPALRSLLDKPKPGPWKHALLKSHPTPALLSRISQENIILGIEVLESLLTMQNLSGGVHHRLGAWAWGLLGRCREVSEMDSEDVSVLRGLGKKACALLRRLRAGEELGEENEAGEIMENDDNVVGEKDSSKNGSEKGNVEVMAEGRHQDENNISEDMKISENAFARSDTCANGIPGNDATAVSNAEDACLEDARTRLLAGLSSADQAPVEEFNDPQNQQQSTHTVRVSDAYATLDIIITLIGECYGQRDLLDARLAWEEL